MTDKEKIIDILLEFYEEYQCNIPNRPMIPSIYASKIIDSLQEKLTTSLWHDASEKAEKGKLYLYRTNQNIVDINRSDGKEFPDYCERWAYIDDLLKF